MENLCVYTAYAAENGALEALKKYANLEGFEAELIAKLYEMLKSGCQLNMLIQMCDEIAESKIRA